MREPLHARASLIHILVLSLIAAQTDNAVGGTVTEAVLSGREVRVEADLADGRLRERYLARTDDGAWVEVAASDGVSGGPVCLYGVQSGPQGNSPQEIQVTAIEVSASANEMTEVFGAGPYRIVRKVSLEGSGPWLRVTTRLEPSQAVELQSVADRFAFSQRSEWSYSPSVGGFNPDAQYKAPLILVQSKRLALGIVPDVTALDRDTLRLCHHALDLDVTASPSLRVGFIPAKQVRHSIYGMDAQQAWKLQRPLENVYFLLVTATAESGQAYRQCVRFHWQRFGRPSQSAAAEQQKGTGPYQGLALFDQWRQRVWDEESRKAWLRIILPDGSTGGGVSTSRALGPRSIYLSSWFNSLRTSFGMALYARRTRNDDLLQLASQTAQLALQSPGANGAFKCIAALDKNNEPVWGAGDGSGGSTIQGYLGYDMSWTAYWLLRWREAQLPGHERILPRCQGLAHFLIARQQQDGMFATFFDEAGNPLKDKAPYTIAETGPVALFLLALYEADKQPQYLDAAKKGLAFLERQVIPQRKWYDFETFWSCSPRGISFDTRTGQWPANDLALGQTVAAFLQAWRVTEDQAYLEKGESLLDYLLLYQQCWTNPLLDGLAGPAMLLGGFTTQNSDAEWSDARQSQFGNILLDYYRATGKAEYLERGVAALRAQFPISPSENWAHGGYGGKAGVSSFHWGSGSGMAGIEIDEEFLHDAIVDVASGTAVGVNGLNVTRCEVGGGKIALEINSPFQWRRELVVTFRRVGPSASYALVVNGITLGVYRSVELEKGIAVPAKDVLSTAAGLPTYSTTFDGDEDPLSEGGKWINNGLDWTKIRQRGGIACGTQTGTNQGIYRYDDSYAHLSGFPPDQEAWAQVRIAKPDPSCHQELEILLRWTSSAHSTTGYECFARCVNDGSSYLQIVRWEGPLGKFTYLADKRGADYGLKDGDTLKASVVGDVITVYVNGVEKAQVKDDTHRTGNPGIGTFLSCDGGRGVGSNADFGFSNFTARGLGAGQRQDTAAPPTAGRPRDYQFEGSISREVLENYLDRSVTMAYFLVTGKAEGNREYLYRDDDVRLIRNIGAKLIGRAIYRWNGESRLNDPNFWRDAKALIEKVHAFDPDVIFQGCLFETISRDVDRVKIPSRVFADFGLPVEDRTFSYEAMLNKDGKLVNHWGRASVPDVTRLETQLWFYYLAGSYIDLGCEALHLGQVGLIGMADPGLKEWSRLVARIRAYAKTHARRKLVLLDAHVPTGGMIVDGVSLLDFNSFPMRIKAIPAKPHEAELQVGHLDSIYKRSKGCISPSGWSCQNLPYLVEFDNFGRSRSPNVADTTSIFVWGWDEISWFSLQDEGYRNQWLVYAYNWIRETDPNGHLEMPVSRMISCPNETLGSYRANTRSPNCPIGYSQEETIKKIWRDSGNRD